MSKARVIVLPVVHQGLSKAEVARKYQVSWQWVHTLVQRYLVEGEAAFKARSSRPGSDPNATSVQVRDLVIALRRELSTQGLDAGPVTIAWHLNLRGIPAPSTSTIRRILTTAGLITLEPKKRPKNSLGTAASLVDSDL